MNYFGMYKVHARDFVDIRKVSMIELWQFLMSYNSYWKICFKSNLWEELNKQNFPQHNNKKKLQYKSNNAKKVFIQFSKKVNLLKTGKFHTKKTCSQVMTVKFTNSSFKVNFKDISNNMKIFNWNWHHE